MVAKFFIDNGAIMGNKSLDMGTYERYEDLFIYDLFLRKKLHFTHINRESIRYYLKMFPDDKVIIIKAPMLIYFVEDLQKLTEREIKVLYVLRNPADVIASTIEKNSKINFMQAFDRYCGCYDMCSTLLFDTYILMAERLRTWEEMRRVLNWAGLNPIKKFADNINKRESFFKFKIRSSVWKRIYRLLPH